VVLLLDGQRVGRYTFEGGVLRTAEPVAWPLPDGRGSAAASLTLAFGTALVYGRYKGASAISYIGPQAKACCGRTPRRRRSAGPSARRRCPARFAPRPRPPGRASTRPPLTPLQLVNRSLAEQAGPGCADCLVGVIRRCE